MNQQEFGEKLQKDIVFVYDADRYEVRRMEVKKITGNYDALLVRKLDSQVGFNLNLDYLYKFSLEKGYETALQTAFNVIGEAGRYADSVCDDVHKLKDWEHTQNLLRIDIVPESAVTKGAVTYDWLNLKVIVSAEFSLGDGQGKTVITESLRKHWGISKAELWAAAIESSPKVCPARIENINKLVFDESNMPEEIKEHLIKELPPLYAVTNEKEYMGAGVVLYPGIMKKMSDLMEGSFYFNFSSRHEALIQPSFLSVEDMKKTLMEVNQALDKEDFMNNSLYFYDAAKGQISEV